MNLIQIDNYIINMDQLRYAMPAYDRGDNLIYLRLFFDADTETRFGASLDLSAEQAKRFQDYLDGSIDHV